MVVKRIAIRNAVAPAEPPVASAVAEAEAADSEEVLADQDHGEQPRRVGFQVADERAAPIPLLAHPLRGRCGRGSTSAVSDPAKNAEKARDSTKARRVEGRLRGHVLESFRCGREVYRGRRRAGRPPSAPRPTGRPLESVAARRELRQARTVGHDSRRDGGVSLQAAAAGAVDGRRAEAPPPGPAAHGEDHPLATARGASERATAPRRPGSGAFHGQTSWQTSQPNTWSPSVALTASGTRPRCSIVQ